ncbi:MAG: hypothetical protein LBO09_02730 [Candidatus Peribacteria bacterium]|nr:hypothetical protein [Candidatus Peribacteria bacterium]
MRNGLLDFPDFKAKYPDLYLAAHELQKIKEILINKKGKVIGYIEKKGEKYGYKTPDKQWKEGLEFDDFRGPDIHGNIITVINGESFFINIDFPLQKAAFKQIEGPDENGNYIAHQNNHTHYLIKKNGTLCGNVRNQIEKPDLNNNYLTSHEGDFCLIDSNGDKISDFYLHIKNADENGYYLATSTQGVNILDKGGYKVVPQFYQNIKRLPSGDYQMQDQGKF